MFYLIHDNLGSYGTTMLVNGLHLKRIEVQTDENNFDLVFYHQQSKNSFSFQPNDIINVNEIISNITNLKPCTYYNHFISVTDIQNTETINKLFGKKSEFHQKIDQILINIEDIHLVYQYNNNYVLASNNDKIFIKESPQQIFDTIEQKIISPSISSEQSKSGLTIKNRL